MVVPGEAIFLLLLLSLLSAMDAEDPVFDVGGALLGSVGGWDVVSATFNPVGALLLVVGAADIDVIWNQR